MSWISYGYIPNYVSLTIRKAIERTLCIIPSLVSTLSLINLDIQLVIGDTTAGEQCITPITYGSCEQILIRHLKYQVQVTHISSPSAMVSIYIMRPQIMEGLGPNEYS